jgi:Uma2 family endonuclease
MSSQGLTYADLLAFPDDGLRREILDGELLESPSPRVSHQRLVVRIVRVIADHIDRSGGGEVFVAPLDVLLSEHDVVEPDVVFVSTSQTEIIGKNNIQGVPALLIEVLSDPRVDRVRKRDRYQRADVPEYWIADPDAERVEVYRLDGDRYGKPEIFEPGDVLTYAQLPGFELDLRALFAEPRA